MTTGRPNVRSAPEPGPGASPEAVQVFQRLAVELEEGGGDPEALFAAHPALERELRGLYRGWLEADALLRSLADEDSLVGSVRRDLDASPEGAREDALVARLADTGFERRYVLGEELGHGGMGLVRRVTDRTLGRDLAMKVIRAVEPGRRRRLLRRFLEEAEIIGRLEHPGIVPIHELGLDPQGQVYFTMPLVRGRTLKEVLRLVAEGREGWTVARVLEVLLKVCDAVAYAHSRAVLHRDLKPANVMVGRFGEVYVMDWGLARSLGRADERGEEAAAPAGPGLTLAGEVLGTPAYMAPEQALGRSEELDERCDVYALGAILYETLAGVRPYGERSSAEALEKLVSEAPPAVESLARWASPELAAITSRAMARDREARYPSVAALAGDLRAYLEGRVVSAHRTGPWVEAKKWVRRNRGLAAGILGTVVALVAGLVVALVLLRSTERERANVFRLAQTRTLAGLIERADALWPPHPELIADMRAWQEEARALVAALEPDEKRGDPGLRAQLAALAGRRAGWSEEDRWWHEELVKLVSGIEELAEPERGLLGEGLGPHGFGIGSRIASAERVQALGARPEVQRLWAEVRESIRADSRFQGLELAPQVGLVPLGKDPDSDLWEFAHVLSGEVPDRDAEGNLRLDDRSAAVLVLLPPGEFLMGSQSDDPTRPNYAPYVSSAELPAHTVALGAFFLGKHELTQGQWGRCTGASPSFFHTETGAEALPVESLSWLRAREGLVRTGLRFPTEAEWEYACRAGTTTEYYWGSDPLEFVRYANVKDESASLDKTTPSHRVLVSQRDSPTEQFVNLTSPKDHAPGSDGFSDLAPVGSLLPNAWGLHDMIGNVHEWCEDRYSLYAVAAPPPRLPQDDLRVFRGGAFNRTIIRSAARNREAAAFLYQNIGVRAARSVEHGG